MKLPRCWGTSSNLKYPHLLTRLKGKIICLSYWEPTLGMLFTTVSFFLLNYFQNIAFANDLLMSATDLILAGLMAFYLYRSQATNEM